MADPTLESDLSEYLARPVTGDRLPVDWRLSPRLIDMLKRLALERGVSTETLVEYALFKAVRADKARLMVGEPLDPVPASFTSALVAEVKAELIKDRAAALAVREERGDRATRIAAEMEAVLHGAQAPDPHLEAVQRQAATSDAMIDQALKKRGG
jgi:hypothetical protein